MLVEGAILTLLRRSMPECLVAGHNVCCQGMLLSRVMLSQLSVGGSSHPVAVAVAMAVDQ